MLVLVGEGAVLKVGANIIKLFQKKMGIKLTARYYLKQIAQRLFLQQAVFYLNRLIFVTANILIIFTITSKKVIIF